MFKDYSAVLTGIVLGIVLMVPLNAGLNKLEQAECDEHGDTHTLVSSRMFFGTTQVCLDKRYI